ncbi:MAG: InlB B-repeat-containing protein [Paludibacteraceae bacterium]|nr:InlB B-repeat-containing protein [Paludibacteraceae bacterium]
MKSNLLKSIFISLILVMGVNNAWGYTLYLYTGNFGSWNDGSAKFQVYANNNINATSLGNNWYSFDVGTFNGTAYIKRMDSNNSTKWNEFSATISSTNNVVHVTNWNQGYVLNYYIKHPWDGNKWSWKQMTFIEPNKYTYTDTYNSGKGANINTYENDDNWIGDDNITNHENVNTGVPALYTYTPSSNNLRVDPAYILTVESDGNGTASGSQSKGIKMSTNYDISATASEGYVFDTWTVTSGNATFGTSANASTTVKVSGNASAIVKATFKPASYSITYKDQGGSNFSGTHASGYPTTHTYGTATTLKTASKTGYTFEGWYEEPACTNKVTTLGATAYTANITLYAKWTANTYIVTLDQEGAAEKGDASVRADYNANMPELGKLPTAQNGYAFMGYFDQKDGKGTQYYYADGTSAHTWDKTKNATLYAYFAVPKIDVTLDKSTFEPGAENVTATAIVTPTPAGTTTICWELLYTNDNPVENHAPSPEKGNRVQFNISDLVAGTYKIKATLRMGDGCEGEEISSSEHTFLISSNHTITIKYICDGKEIQSKTTIEANVSSTTTYTAPDIIGYTFKEWVAGDGVIISTADKTKKDIEFTAYYDGYLTATYTKNDNIIYFYNTLGWQNVYVYFYSSDKYWDNTMGSGSKKEQTFTNGDDKDHKPHYREYRGTMTHIAGTQIWYYDCSVHGDEIKGYTNVVFNKYQQDDYEWFSNTEVVRRGDMDADKLPMFVPIKGQNPELKNNNTTKYYNKGYWMNYPENTGYKLQIYDGTGNGAKEVASVRFPYSTNTIMPLTVSVDLEAGKTYGFKILREDNTYFSNIGTMTANSNGWSFTNDVSQNCGLQTTLAGDYTFTLKYAAPDQKDPNNYQYCVDVVYPVSVGDYRVVYTDNAQWSQTAAHGAKWYHPSYAIKKNSSATEEKTDIVSFFIAKNNSPAMKFQKCTAINGQTVTWADVENGAITPPKDKTETSVYNFIVKQPAGGASISVESVEPYTGNYYIRVDAMDGKWGNYKTNPDNRMFYSAFSESDANSFGDKFSHYATKWCEAGTNVKFTIANDYSHCISDTLAQDINSLGNLTDEGTLLNNDIYDVNIRFMWNWKTNKISRAYVGPAGDKQSQFLMLKACEEIQDAEGNKLNPAEGDILDEENDIYAARFTDTQNWIYERTIQVKPRTRVKLYASYPNGYHIYIENNTGWKDVALYAFKNGEGEPLGTWPGVQPTRTVKIGDKTYYDFPVNKYVFGSTLIFNNNVKENGQQTSNYTDFATVGEYYLTASSNKELTKNKYVQTTVEATAQYFRGEYAEGSCDDEHTIQILGGEGETWNTIRVIYDFKTNRLMAAWMPNNNEIDTVRSIESDVMIIRDHQNAAQCITFANDSSKLTYVKTVYGVMRFNRWILNNRGGEKNLDIKSCTKVVDNQTVYDHDTTNLYHPVLTPENQKSQYERALYFISFPFNVHLSDVFGFGTYGQHWIIEYYDGLKRAKEGYWIDSDPNWKYVTDPANFVLEKYKGYILCLNLGKMAYDNTDFWAHNISQVELFFPSTTTMEEIAKAEVTMPKLGEEYLCKINRGNGTEGDRRVKDSYWRCIGVPSYANYSNVLKDEEGNPIQWQTSYKTFPFLYKWNKTDNTLTPQSTTNFKFETMHAYLVQNGGEIHWSAVNATPDKPNAGIIAKVKETTRNYEWRITLTQGEKEHDQAFVRLSDNEQVTTEFDFNQDLSKEFNYGRSDIYTLIGYEKAAANSLPLSEQTTLIPLGLSIEYNGDYTIAMPDGTANIGVTLIDTESNTRTNLSAGMEYTLTLKKGDYNNRFFIEISPIQQTPTDIEYVTGDSNSQNSVRKVLIDNILYIVRDGQIFDARGARVK